jgi:thiamine biosynthesis protein ThiI
VASAEFTLKSSPVRRTLEQRLIDDLKVSMKRKGIDGCKLEKDAGRIIVRRMGDAEKAARCCAKVFGVAYAAPAKILPASMDSVIKDIVKLADEDLTLGQSFAIRTHRATPSPLSRHEIEIKGGSEVLRRLESRAVRVNLKNPDLTIFVDLVDDHAYVYDQRLTGPGGLPLSSQWKMLVILDSGPLSILAAYSMMRRGCLVEPLLPLSDNLPFFARDQQLHNAQTIRELVTRESYRIFTLDFDQSFRRASSPNYYEARSFAREAGTKFAAEKKFKGIILPDVAGPIGVLKPQHAEGVQINPPIFQPLIGLSSQDLVEMSKEVGISENALLSQMELEKHEMATRVLNVTEDSNGVKFGQLLL